MSSRWPWTWSNDQAMARVSIQPNAEVAQPRTRRIEGYRLVIAVGNQTVRRSLREALIDGHLKVPPRTFRQRPRMGFAERSAVMLMHRAGATMALVARGNPLGHVERQRSVTATRRFTFGRGPTPTCLCLRRCCVASALRRSCACTLLQHARNQKLTQRGKSNEQWLPRKVHRTPEIELDPQTEEYARPGQGARSAQEQMRLPSSRLRRP